MRARILTTTPWRPAHFFRPINFRGPHKQVAHPICPPPPSRSPLWLCWAFSAEVRKIHLQSKSCFSPSNDRD
jgi:hypothetical protein